MDEDFEGQHNEEVVFAHTTHLIPSKAPMETTTITQATVHTVEANTMEEDQEEAMVANIKSRGGQGFG